MYGGLGILPEQDDPLGGFYAEAEVEDALRRIRETVVQLAATAPSHERFIAATCAAPR